MSVKNRVERLEKERGKPEEGCTCRTTGNGAGWRIIHRDDEGAVPDFVAGRPEAADTATICRLCGKVRPVWEIRWEDNWPPDRPDVVRLQWPEGAAT